MGCAALAMGNGATHGAYTVTATGPFRTPGVGAALLLGNATIPGAYTEPLQVRCGPGASTRRYRGISVWRVDAALVRDLRAKFRGVYDVSANCY